jgi:hypothetical protein
MSGVDSERHTIYVIVGWSAWLGLRQGGFLVVVMVVVVVVVVD